MQTVIIKTAQPEDFFTRGRHLAKLADAGERLPHERVISFEDPAELLQLLTPARLALFQAIKDAPGSITAIAERLHRNRRAVKRDLDALARYDLVMIEAKALPGHGRMKEVSIGAEHYRLEAQLP
jgi:predicted transcriptional regulator